LIAAMHQKSRRTSDSGGRRASQCACSTPATIHISARGLRF